MFDVPRSHLWVADDCFSRQIARSPRCATSAELFVVNESLVDLKRVRLEIKMILTTPFCPYAGSMIAQVKEQVESVVEHDVKVTLLAERWDPRDAGLMW